MDPRCLFLGILSTATSVGITARILSEKRSIDTPEGTSIMAAAVIDDVLGIICLAIVMGVIGLNSASDSASVWKHIGVIAIKTLGVWIAFTVAGLVCAHYFARFLKLLREGAGLAVLSFGASLLLAGIFEKCGLAMIIGAYVTGLSLSKTDITYTVQDNLRGLYDFLVPVFFVVMGMLVDVRTLADWDTLKFGILYSILAILAKIIGCMLPALLMNFTPLGAVRIGIGMIPRGEVALIIAGIGATTMMKLNGEDVPIVDTRLFGVAIIMTLVTTVVAPPLLSFVLGLKGRSVRHEKADAGSTRLCFPMPSYTVRDFLVRELVSNFMQEGFRHSEYSIDHSVINFRKERTTFNMTMNGNEISFECSPVDVPTIKAILNETSFELYQNLEKLRSMTLPEAGSKVLDGKELGQCIIPYTANAGYSLAKIIPENCAITDLQSTTYRDALEEIARHLFRCGYINSFNECLNDILAREELSSTVLSGGIAMPHAKSNSVISMVSVIALCKIPVKADAPEADEVHIIVLTVSPKDHQSPYMQYIAHIASVLHKYPDMEKLRSIASPEELRKQFI